MTFKKIQIKSRVINALSKHVVAAYLFDGALRMLIGSYILQWNEYIYKPILPLIIVIILFVCLLIDALRSVIIAPIEKRVATIVINSYVLLNKVLERMAKELLKVKYKGKGINMKLLGIVKKDINYAYIK